MTDQPNQDQKAPSTPLSRVLDELMGLNEKQKKLSIFIKANTAFTNLDAIDQDLLVSQLSIMQSYAAILMARVRRMTDQQPDLN